DRQRAVRHHEVEHLGGIRRPRLVVLLRDFAEDEPLRARHAGFCCTRSKIRAVQPAISTGGSSSVTIRPAISFNAIAADERGAANTTGVPSPPPAETAGSIGIDPTSGAPANSANPSPPPVPKMACEEPSGATNALMFSTTPSTFRYERRAMSATRAAM